MTIFGGQNNIMILVPSSISIDVNCFCLSTPKTWHKNTLLWYLSVTTITDENEARKSLHSLMSNLRWPLAHFSILTKSSVRVSCHNTWHCKSWITIFSIACEILITSNVSEVEMHFILQRPICNEPGHFPTLTKSSVQIDVRHPKKQFSSSGPDLPTYVYQCKCDLIESTEINNERNWFI